MAENLVIVESPTKAKLIKNFLGKNYTVLSSYGHIRDLPSKKSELSLSEQKLPYATLAIDTAHDYAPLYVTSPEKKKRLSALKEELDLKTTIWLATDEDREGEAIGWHILEVLKPKTTNAVQRIVFHEITKEAILEAIAQPRNLDMNLVNAQQARRILDRLVGYELSPLLWKKIRFGLSAGRVQSVAVRLIVEREREIKAFVPEESWSLTAHFEHDSKHFTALFQRIGEKKITLRTESEAQAILGAISGGEFTVSSVEEKEVRRSPTAPFTTSTLQQEASRQFGFPVKKTMQVAQKLYEGVQFGKGKNAESAGLITYMRTDSVNLSEKALTEARSVIQKEYGKEYALSEPRRYKTKSKGAQEAHEAIRPTQIARTPQEAEEYLTPDEFKLYTLIWKRTVASQMAEAKLKNTGVDLMVRSNAGAKHEHFFRATGQVILFPGFMKLYLEGRDDEDEEDEKILPELQEGQKLAAEKIEPKQHFTKPPARYTEASLVKKLEEEGIGRPSTYAPTISTIMGRGYVLREGKALFPSDTAYVVTDFLTQHFPNIVDLKFTAGMEEDLDEIAEGKKDYVKFLDSFYPPFKKIVQEKDKTVNKSDVVIEHDDELEACPKCGSKLVIKLSRFGKFVSCGTFPTCDYSRPLEKPDPAKEAELKELQEKLKDEKCPECGAPMVVKNGRFGEFLACTKYPKCKGTKAIEKQIGMKCPECKKGEIVEKRTKRAKTFWGCNRYPKCKYASWDDPRKASSKE